MKLVIRRRSGQTNPRTRFALGEDQVLNLLARYFSVRNITRNGSDRVEAADTVWPRSLDSITCHRLTCTSIAITASAARVIPANRFAVCQVVSLIIDRAEP